ncbi:MAG: hypothetical protein QF819_05230 [Gemmatimonadota bacterium]|jgi:hypothetical protein|nr:hypothetical protein [Gemmatimonadota bacterium]MDP6529107.1 hypothetical protein [Gemmatimonadota bacterium]MDP6802564.1 hypothetical protein [Gemmatimonadota bacterium]MDP7031827.1 hypothetical protein [Gemmatimonadota bacterium]
MLEPIVILIYGFAGLGLGLVLARTAFVGILGLSDPMTASRTAVANRR